MGIWSDLNGLEYPNWSHLLAARDEGELEMFPLGDPPDGNPWPFHDFEVINRADLQDWILLDAAVATAFPDATECLWRDAINTYRLPVAPQGFFAELNFAACPSRQATFSWSNGGRTRPVDTITIQEWNGSTWANVPGGGGLTAGTTSHGPVSIGISAPNLFRISYDSSAGPIWVQYELDVECPF